MRDFPDQKTQKARYNLLMIGMFSIVMLFAGLTSAYIVSKGALGNQWDVISLPNMFFLSTLVILLSSVSGYFSVQSCKSDHLQMMSRLLLLTILLGVSFCVGQFLSWKVLISNQKFLSGNNVASSYLYVLTLLHFLHMMGGMIALIVVYLKCFIIQYFISLIKYLLWRC